MPRDFFGGHSAGAALCSGHLFTAAAGLSRRTSECAGSNGHTPQPPSALGGMLRANQIGRGHPIVETFRAMRAKMSASGSGSAATITGSFESTSLLATCSGTGSLARIWSLPEKAISLERPGQASVTCTRSAGLPRIAASAPAHLLPSAWRFHAGREVWEKTGGGPVIPVPPLPFRGRAGTMGRRRRPGPMGS